MAHPRLHLLIAETAAPNGDGTWDLGRANLRELKLPALPMILDLALVLSFSFDEPVKDEPVSIVAQVAATTPGGLTVSALRLVTTFQPGDFSSVHPWTGSFVFEEVGLWTFRLSVPGTELALIPSSRPSSFTRR